MWSNIGRKSLAIILAVSIILIGVYLKINAQSVEIYTPLKPTVMPSYWPTQGWEYATPTQMGIDSHSLEAMIQDIKSSSYQVDSALVIKNGYIVLDEYFGNYRKGNLHNIFSCTKSVVSTLFGIAYEKGDIPDLDTRLLALYPEIIPENQGNWKESITLRHLLMMSAGFDARDSWLYEWE